jgi:5-methylcytosine-specific restriction endonuclease McrA
MMTGEKSYNCSEDSYTPVIDNFINIPALYSLCSEEAMIMVKTGKTLSEEHKNNISKGLLSSDRVWKTGMIPWNKGLKGVQVPWNKGTKMPELIGNTNGFRKGQVPWNKGKTHSEEHKKKLSDNHADFRGDKSPTWQGGKSFEPYCHKFNDKLKEQIRDRDDRTCQLCNAKENGEKLSVHHIHYDKENCEPDLIALCRRCNSKVNQNRDYYERLFMENLMNRNIIEVG